jgi:hypothetical protein
VTWRLAKCIPPLVEEVDERSPHRSKISDGTIGNAAHQSRDSDHNPWVKDGNVGVVTAVDITHDPANGFDSYAFAEWLRKRCKAGDENRVKYVISNRRIASATVKPGYPAWTWRPYDGENPHTHHVHVSVRSEKKYYDNAGPWGWYEEDDMPSPKDYADAVWNDDVIPDGETDDNPTWKPKNSLARVKDRVESIFTMVKEIHAAVVAKK